MICRTIHNKNYTIVNNTICKDNRLSWKAKGIWLYAFSRPDDWTFHIEDLIKQSTDGKDAVRSGLQELQKCGYLKRERIRNNDGTLGGSEWVFHEIPQPKAENPTLDSPILEEPPLLSTEAKLSTEAASKQATEDAFALLACLPFSEAEKESFANSFDADQCRRAVAFFKGKRTVCPDFVPDNGWPALLAAAIRKGWEIPELPAKKQEPKTHDHINANKAAAAEMHASMQSGLDIHSETLTLYPDYISYRHFAKDIKMQLFFSEPDFAAKLDHIKKTILNKRREN